MLKILNASQIKALDKATIEGEPISSLDLMERASLAFVQWFVRKFNHTQKVGVVCGTGNNGGDGLAIARLLRERRYIVSTWIVRGEVPETDDFKKNLGRLVGSTPVEISTAPGKQTFDGVDVLVDAMFGSGLSRPLKGVYAETVEAMNRAAAIRVSVDIPSGLMADGPSSGPAVKAHHTVTFQLPKLSFMLPSSGPFTGDWEIVDIGLSENFISQTVTANYYLTAAWARTQKLARSKFAHKGDFGTVLVVAGSLGKMGACILATRAALRSGAGLVTAHVPGCGYEIIQTAVPEAMASRDSQGEFVSEVPDLDRFDTIAVGPGLGTNAGTARAVEKILRTAKNVVIDADAINLLSEHSSLRKLLHPKVILTPHPGEFRRLVGEWPDDFARLDLQRKLSAETGATVVLKGAHTSVATPDGNVYFNSTGNPGMATGGSGDVLTGMIAGLLAQGMEVRDAAALGVFVHGKCGDLALAQNGSQSIIASDIIDMIPSGFRSLF